LLIAVDSQNPELAMLERKRVSASARAELARLEARPDFSLGVTYITVSDTGANPTLTDAGQDPWGVSLAVSLPIWAGRNTAARREADASVRAVEKEIEDRQNKLAADTQVAFSVLRDAKRRIELYEDELLPLARQALENTTAAYESASVSLLELIDSERSLLELDLSLWRAHADAAQQKIVLQTLANQPIR
jgi:outer membrane protein TolC